MASANQKLLTRTVSDINPQEKKKQRKTMTQRISLSGLHYTANIRSREQRTKNLQETDYFFFY